MDGSGFWLPKGNKFLLEERILLNIFLQMEHANKVFRIFLLFFSDMELST